MKVTLRRKVCNAADRRQDRWYERTVPLPFAPPIGTTIVAGGRCYTVSAWRLDVDAGEATATLNQDNTTFKEPETFEQRCRIMESAKFHEAKEQST